MLLISLTNYSYDAFDYDDDKDDDDEHQRMTRGDDHNNGKNENNDDGDDDDDTVDDTWVICTKDALSAATQTPTVSTSPPTLKWQC